MTREEIRKNIEILSELRSKYDCFDEKEEPFYHALSLGIKGIKALEQEPCEDCISKEYLLSIANEDGAYGYVSAYDIASAPSVNPQESKTEPKMGHWISHKEHCKQLGVMPSGCVSFNWCSECDCGVNTKYFQLVNYNHCPNCRAKMEG